MWTQFWDMHSGGSQKEKWARIYIEAPEEEAKVIFYNRFGHNPERITCTCCGDDYSIEEKESLEQLSAFHRGCAYAYVNSKGEEVPENEAWIIGEGIQDGYEGKYIETNEQKYPRYRFSFQKEYLPLDDYKKQPDVLVISKKEITQEERTGDIPEQGYVWVD